MVGISGGGGGGGGYNYVQDAQPADPSEGEEWYDTGTNKAYVYDGASWVELTVVDHGQLSGVGASDHHTRPTGTMAGGSEQSTSSNYSLSNTAAASSHTFSVSPFITGVRIDQNTATYSTSRCRLDLKDRFGNWHTNVLVAAGVEDVNTVNLPTEYVGTVRLRYDPNESGDKNGDVAGTAYVYHASAGSHTHSI